LRKPRRRDQASWRSRDLRSLSRRDHALDAFLRWPVSQACPGRFSLSTSIRRSNGSKTLSNPRHERYCGCVRNCFRNSMRSATQDLPRKPIHTAYSNVYRLEKRKDVQDRIAYFCRQDEEVLQETRKRIEEGSMSPSVKKSRG
jgi:hypothetical protein